MVENYNIILTKLAYDDPEVIKTVVNTKRTNNISQTVKIYLDSITSISLVE